MLCEPRFEPPPSWTVVTTLEAHTAGEPLRVVVRGAPDVPGATLTEKRRWAMEHLEPLRRALMWEPRGHADMYGALLTEPVTPDGDAGVLFMHNEGWSTMCGHGVIALATVLLEAGRVDPPGEGEEAVIRLDTPAGRVTARARCDGRRVERVSFRNVPSFVLARDRVVEVPGLGSVRYDVAFGGAFYAFVESGALGLALEPRTVRRLIEAGMAVKRAVAEDLEITHPFEPDLSFLYGTIFYCPPRDPARFSRNVCIFADGEVDRSPTGTGVSARAALHFARGEIALREPFTVESLLGTCMTGCAVEETRFGPHAAVVPEVTGRAHLAGRCTWWIDPEDPIREGFFLR